MSEGRGTEAPFLIFGAPWLKPETVVPKLPTAGLTYQNAVFTPMPDPAGRLTNFGRPYEEPQ